MSMNDASPQPTLVTTVDELRRAVAAARADGRSIGLVPTMGALHEGHLSLVRASKAECGMTVVSIFVNPSQFGPSEDLAAYPRTLDADLDKLAECGTDLVFAPDNEEVYAEGHATWVEVGAVARPLEGECRPTHFRGVATVVLKLLNMVGPDVAYFGAKDYQQAQVIRRMVADLDVPAVIRVCPIVREPDGLAMSSRNAYLDANARRRAAVLWKSLCLADELVNRGERDGKTIVRRMREAIESAPDARIDYVALVDPETLEPVERIEGRALAALAVRIGATRLIDNRLLEI
jgi:pantoate--beta-alanine ligase